MHHTDQPSPGPDEQSEGEPVENRDPASYATFANGDLGFDPTKDLNLPGSYDEVLARFKRLQGDRAWEVLN